MVDKKILDFSKFKDKPLKFKKKRGRPPVRIPSNFNVLFEWVELSRGGEEKDMSLLWNPNSPWHTLKRQGKQIVIGMCFEMIHKIYSTDPSLEAELIERMEQLYARDSETDNT